MTTGGNEDSRKVKLREIKGIFIQRSTTES